MNLIQKDEDDDLFSLASRERKRVAFHWKPKENKRSIYEAQVLQNGLRTRIGYVPEIGTFLLST